MHPSWTRLVARESHVANLSVRRALPRPQRRAVGPFVFLDEMGPVAFAAGEGLDVGPHPHAGLATLTYLLEGALVRRDSLGTTQRIEPGQVNWMSAGAAVMHSERSPERQRPHRLHGLQFWIALPPEQASAAPWFVHRPAELQPELSWAGVRGRLLAGEAFGARAHAQLPYHALLAELSCGAGARLPLPEANELALYLLHGTLALDDGPALQPGELALAPPAAQRPAALTASSDARVVLLGGEPLEAPRRMEWNFVASSADELEAIKARWAAGAFAPVAHDPG